MSNKVNTASIYHTRFQDRENVFRRDVQGCKNEAPLDGLLPQTQEREEDLQIFRNISHHLLQVAKEI